MEKAFPGFPKDALRFLRLLKRHNNREWFLEHKGIYETSVKRPMEQLITALSHDFDQFAPEMVASPKVSAYRIHRDTRFSKDKSPYKTHVAAVFPHKRLGKHEGAGFYLHVAPSEVFVGGGLYRPLPEDLNAVRQRIAEKPKVFLNIVNGRSFRTLFGEVSGERLRKAPRGFFQEHPASEHLKLKQFLAGRDLEPALSTSPEFYELIVSTFRAMLPFIRFLNEPIVNARKIRERQEKMLEL